MHYQGKDLEQLLGQYDGHADVVMVIMEEVCEEISIEKGEIIEVQSDDEDNGLDATSAISAFDGSAPPFR